MHTVCELPQNDNVCVLTAWWKSAFRNTNQFLQKYLSLFRIPISKRVPCAAARFPFDIVYQPDNILKDKYVNLIHSRDFPSGGHFAALENPKQLVKDIYAAVEKMEEMHDCQCMALKKP